MLSPVLDAAAEVLVDPGVTDLVGVVGCSNFLKITRNDAAGQEGGMPHGDHGTSPRGAARP